jgi:glucose-1-phosphate adenylyltransferase
MEHSLVGEGGRIEQATIRRSVIGRGVTIERDAVVEESVIMDYARVGAGCRLRRTIVDRHNDLEPGTELDPDKPLPGERCFLDTAARVVAVARGGIAAPPEDLPLAAGESDSLGAF